MRGIMSFIRRGGFCYILALSRLLKAVRLGYPCEMAELQLFGNSTYFSTFSSIYANQILANNSS